MPRKLALLASFILIITLAWFVKKAPTVLFPINSIECSLIHEPCPDELLRSLQPLRGKSLFFTHIEQEITALNLNFYELSSVKKKLPGTITVVLITSEQSYIVQLPDKNPLLVAQSGVVRAPTTAESLPAIIASSHWTHPIQNDQLDPSLHQLNQQLLAGLKKHQIPFTRIEVQSPNEIIVYLPNNKKALMSHDQPDVQAQKLSIILKNIDLSTVDTGISIIDLRFKLPVLKT